MPSVLWHCWLVSGRASSLQKLSDEVLVWLSVCSEVHIVCTWSSWSHYIPKPHHLLPHLNPDSFLLFWYRLATVVLEKTPLNGRSNVVSFHTRPAARGRALLLPPSEYAWEHLSRTCLGMPKYHLQIAPFHLGIQPLSNRWFPGPTRVHIRNLDQFRHFNTAHGSFQQTHT